MPRHLLSIVLSALCTIVLSLAQSASAEQELVIMSSFPLTGSANNQATSLVRGIELALAQSDGRAGAFKLRYQSLDDASAERGNWDPAVEAANATQAAMNPQVVAYIGPYNSGAAKIAMPALNAVGLAIVNPTATWPGLTKAGLGEANEPQVYRPSGRINFFRTVPADDIQGVVAARWAKEMNLRKVFVIHDRELYGRGIASVFVKTAKEVDLEILGEEGIDTHAANFRSLITKIRQHNPDLVYFGGTTQTNAGQFAKDLASSRSTAKLMVPDGCYENAFIEAAGAENLENRVFITFGGVPGSMLTGRGQGFYEEYRRRYSDEPAAYAVYSYEAANVIIDAIKRANSADRAAILTEISRTKDFDGALGRWSFDENGDTTLRSMSGNTVQGGKFVFVKMLS